MTSEFQWRTPDQLFIYAKEWSVQNPRAVVCIVHGLGEHCNRYNHVADFFNQNGFAVVGYDRRGHGQSEGNRGGTPSYKAYLDEVHELVEQAESRYRGLPIILYGHSMGGNIALNYLLERKPNVQGIITTGAWMKLVNNPPKALILLGKLMNALTGGFTQSNDLDPNDVSRDKAVVKAYIDDPLVHDKISSKAGVYTYEAGLKLFNYTGNVPVPALLMHGSEDKLVSVEGSRVFSQQASGNITYKEWDGLYHEIHNDPEQKEVLQYAVDWIEKEVLI